MSTPPLIPHCLRAVALLSLAATAQAGPLLIYKNGDGCTMSTACHVAPEVHPGKLLSNLSPADWANGYIADNPWSVGRTFNVPSPVFTMRVDALSAVRLDTLAFGLFNNDCQKKQPVACTGANWALSLALNDGAYGAPIYEFNSGGTFNDLHASVKLDQFLKAGDSLGLRISYLNGFKDSTAQYFFHDVSINGAAAASVPEPSALALAGLAGLAALAARRRARPGLKSQAAERDCYDVRDQRLPKTQCWPRIQAA